ncbi:MAG: hypothetical protein KF850_24380 [Labilithrix sp.]|nr:hypothetical protein [Labilithrix sp.]MBX3215195.1 hypothetical protein [Labilithrix sp.]
MTADELLSTMRAALEAEREAIRRLDGAAVTEAAAAKEKILLGVHGAPASERPALVAALKELKIELRRNLLLLAHARDYVREAIELCHPSGRGRLEAKL